MKVTVSFIYQLQQRRNEADKNTVCVGEAAYVVSRDLQPRQFYTILYSCNSILQLQTNSHYWIPLCETDLYGVKVHPWAGSHLFNFLF
jgi:hypothetical protein